MLIRTLLQPSTPATPAATGCGLPPLPRVGAGDGLGPGGRRGVVATIIVAHGVAIWGLLQVQAVRDAAVQAAPILVSLLAAPTPPAPPPPAPAPPIPKPQPRAKVRPASRPPVLATPAGPAPEAVAVGPPQEAPAPVAAAPSASTAAPEPAPAAPPAPKLLPDDAVQYLQAPLVVYPPLSLRRRETGLVVVRAYVGTEGGVARTVQVERTSGHARLDQAAVAAVQQARFRPYAENGRPVEGWALIPIRFELEK